MFDLEKSIAEWRNQMFAAGIEAPVPLEELESHLREEIERQLQSGLDSQPAFDNAIGRIGSAGLLKTEFGKAGIPIRERLKRSILTLAGIPDYQLATNMNTTRPNLEPCWATYVKAGTFLFPAMLLWLFTVETILPSINGICAATATSAFSNFQDAPAWLKAWAAIGQAMLFMADHWFLIGSVIVLVVVVLERYFTQWPRYRRTAIAIGAFLLNTLALLAMAAMMISLLVASQASLGLRK